MHTICKGKVFASALAYDRDRAFMSLHQMKTKTSRRKRHRLRDGDKSTDSWRRSGDADDDDEDDDNSNRRTRRPYNVRGSPTYEPYMERLADFSPLAWSLY